MLNESEEKTDLPQEPGNESFAENTGEEKKKRAKKEIIEWVRSFAIALAVTIFVTQVLVVNAWVPSSSMENTLFPNDRILGLRTSYWFGNEPERGEIIIFHFPDNEEQLYIKRIIGLPGETVTIENGTVYIDNVLLESEQEYLAESFNGNYGPYTVPDGCYFVMGDNRNRSSDSRYWRNTFVRRDQIVARAAVRIFPNPTVLK